MLAMCFSSGLDLVLEKNYFQLNLIMHPMAMATRLKFFELVVSIGCV